MSLDVFRGVTIAGMLLVNNPGTWEHVYGPLRHAEWHGCTPTDVIFPFFLFIMGVAMSFSLGGKVGRAGVCPRGLVGRTVRRVVVLVGLGIGLAMVAPVWRAVAGGGGFSMETVRVSGVLQRIGLCYAVAAAVVLLGTDRRWRLGLIGVSLVGHWVLLTVVPVPGADAAMGLARMTEECNLQRWLDRLVLGETRLYGGSATDPEGLLGTLPAAATVLIGYELGQIVRRLGRTMASVRALVWIGVGLAAAGVVWSVVLPLNKPLWTGSYVLWTAGLASVCLGACVWVVDLTGSAWRARVGRVARGAFESYGVNAITAFVGSGVMARAMTLVEVGEGGRTLKDVAYGLIAGVAGGDGKFGSLVYAAGFVVVWWAVLRAMDAMGWRIRV